MSRVLLVEDDAPLAEGIEYALKNEGFDVKYAKDLETADLLYKGSRFDLVLLDLMLPDGSGYSLCKKIREVSDTPIIFLTACDEEVNVVMGLDMGGDDYITKPFRLKELVSRINAVLRRHGGNNTNAPVLVSGCLQIFTLQGKVKKRGSDLFLTAMEYRLLLTLVKNSGRVLSRNSILEALWDIEGEFVDDNTLSVYIKRLREKIEDVPSEPVHIITVRGMGYKWDSEVRGE